MKRLHWIVLRKLPGPFFGWLGTLMFLLLMQFLIRWLPEIAGKGIPLPVILELIVYNLAYMVVLAVPMSVLLASLMTYGSLAESQYFAVIKSTGISFTQLVWPSLVVAAMLTGGMLYFNNVMLPESNHRARYLWKDIRTKRPGFELQPGVFYGGVDDYNILVRDRRPQSNELEGITIYDYTQGRARQAVIKAARGRIEPDSGGSSLTLVLENGEMHRPLPPDARHPEERYERLKFDRHRLRLDLSSFVFERSSPRESQRSDRTMRTSAMVEQVDSLLASRETEWAQLRTRMERGVQPDSSLARAVRARMASDSAAAPGTGSASRSGSAPGDAPTPVRAVTDPASAPGTATENGSAAPPSAASRSGASPTTKPPPGAPWPTHTLALEGLTGPQQKRVASLALQSARGTQSEVRNGTRTLEWKNGRIQRYRVEIYKKYSIAVACLIFMFIGAPLGLSIRRGGLATIGGVALGIFMFYWVTLVQGEKLADRGLLPPWIGMWIANAIMLVVGAWLVLYVVLDLRATPPLRRRVWVWLTGRDLADGQTHEE